MLFKTSREISVSVPLQYVTQPDLDTYIKETVISNIVNLHDGTGIVMPGTIRILSRSPLVLDTLKFDGSYKCYVRYYASCADAPKGTTFLTEVQTVLPNGVIATTTSPKMKTPIFRVFIPYAIHDDDTIRAIQTLVKGDIIRGVSVGRKGGIGDETILVLARFIEKVDKRTGEVLPIVPSTEIATRKVVVQSQFSPEYFRPEPVNDMDEIKQPLPTGTDAPQPLEEIPFEEIPMEVEGETTVTD